MSKNPANPATMPTIHDETQRHQSFTLQTREHCEWYLKKLAQMDQEEAIVAAQAEKMLRRIRANRERFTGRYKSQFDSFVRGEVAQDKSGARSVVFFHGTAQLRTVAARLVVKSEADAITTAALVCPEAISEVPASQKLDKSKLLAYAREHFKQTGEVLPGLDRTEPGESLTVTFASKDEETDGEGEQEP
jgi:hypothetical protein